MKSILKQKVTIYTPNGKNNPLITSTLGNCLNVNFEENEYTKDILNYREKQDKELKFRTIPFFQIGETFNTSLGGLKGGIEMVVLDIDGKDNKDLSYDTMLERLKALDYVSICIESIGGNGIWLPILLNTAIKTNLEYKTAYKQISSHIEAKTGLKVDNSCCNINRARFFGWSDKGKCFIDETKFSNEFEIKESFVVEEVKKNLVLQTKTNNKWVNDFYEQFEKPILKRKIETLLWMVEKERIDIETSFQDWKALAQSIWNCLGESGLDYFLRFCQFYCKGDNIEKDLELWERIKGIKTKYDISKIFQLAKKSGLDTSGI